MCVREREKRERGRETDRQKKTVRGKSKKQGGTWLNSIRAQPENRRQSADWQSTVCVKEQKIFSHVDWPIEITRIINKQNMEVKIKNRSQIYNVCRSKKFTDLQNQNSKMKNQLITLKIGPILTFLLKFGQTQFKIGIGIWFSLSDSNYTVFIAPIWTARN